MILPFLPLDQSMHPTVVKPKILVVDSDEIVARDLQSQLAAMGYEIAGHVTRSEQAIVLAGELRPDLVLMDVQLAGEMDGIATARGIRSQFSLPVVFMVAFADDETLARARLAEPYGYIRKPFSANVLATVVELALNRHKTEKQLRQSEERLRLVLLGSRDGVWDRDLIQNEVYYSPRWFEMFGYADNELPSASAWHRLIHPDDLGRATQLVAQVGASDALNYELEIRLRHKAGHYLPILSRGFVVRDAHGKAIRVAGTDTDLTSRKQLEEKQLKSEQRFKTIFDAEPECVKVLGPTGDLLEMNPAGLAMLETGSVAEARSHGLLNFVLPAHQAAFGALHGRVMDGESGVLEFEIIGTRGTRRWLETHAAPIRDETGRVTMLLGVTRDITAQKQAAEALRRSEENLAITLQSISDAVIATDAAGLITRMNAAAERLTGWMLPDAAGRHLAEVFRIVNTETRVPLINPVQLVMESGEVIGVANHTALIARDGQEYQISDSAAPIRDAAGQIRGVVLIFSDVTDEYRIRQAYARTSALLERTSELANVGGWELDVRTMKMFWSRETFRIHEMDAPVAPAIEDGIKLFAPEAQPIIRAAMRVAIDNGTPYDLELRKTTAKGRAIWVRTQCAAVMESGKVVKLVGAFHDITARKQAQIALHESEGRYRSIVEWSPEPVAISRDGKLAYVNPAAITMFGASAAQDLVGKPLLDRIHADSRQKVQAWLRRVSEGVTVVPLIELKFLKLDGTAIDVEIQSVSIVYDGAPAMHTSMRDITERKQAERALAEAQRRTTVLAQVGRELAEASTPKAAAIHILDAAQQLLQWDAAWLQLSDEEQQHRVDVVNFDLIDGEIREVLHDASFGQPPSRMARRVKAEGPQLLLRDTGSDAGADIPTFGSGRRSLSLMYVPIRLAGRFIGILSIQSYQRHAYDEADLELLASLATHCAGALLRLQSVETLQESELRYRALVEWSPEAITVHRDGIVIYANPVAFRMFGTTTAKDLLGTPVLDRIHPDFRQSVLKRLKYMTDGGNTPMVVLKCLKVDGTAIDVEVQSTSIVYDGKPAIHVAMRDITERAHAEAARASLEAQLRESQKMEAIGTLAGGVAHDFNNILAAILGNIELARDDVGSNPRALESLEEIRKAAARARDLVQQILSFSRRQPIDRKVITLGPVVEESARLLRTALPPRVVLDIHCEPDVPAVLANANQIEQVLINLVNNAAFAIRGGSGQIRIRLDTAMLDAVLAEAHPALFAMHLKYPGRTVRLAVSDDGLGMDAATLARIFEPFFTTKPVNEGTGLGLSVVHGIVQAHEGAIEVESQPRKGSTFTLYFPVSVAKYSDADEPDKSDVVTVPKVNASGGQRILYLDDDESLVFLVQRLMERRGYRISGYTNQGAALDALRADPTAFDRVVTDYNMPGMSGLDVARAVRTIRADLPVAVASGFIDETLRAQAESAGVQELIFKASAVEDLCDAFVRLAQMVGQESKDRQ